MAARGSGDSTQVEVVDEVDRPLDGPTATVPAAGQGAPGRPGRRVARELVALDDAEARGWSRLESTDQRDVRTAIALLDADRQRGHTVQGRDAVLQAAGESDLIRPRQGVNADRPSQPAGVPSARGVDR